MTTNSVRRKLLKGLGFVFVSTPLAAASSNAEARTNPELRTKLKYQDTPKDGNSCANCLAFQPTKNDPVTGKCSIIPDDDEISAKGYCDGWFTM